MYWVPEKKYSMNAFLKTVEANQSHTTIFSGGGGGGVSESTDRRGCAILALEVVPISGLHKNPTQKFILQNFMLGISTRKTMHHY